MSKNQREWLSDELRATLTGLSDSVTTLGTGLTGARNDIVGLTGRVNKNEQDIAGLTGRGASGISFFPAQGLDSTNLQAAIVEVKASQDAFKASVGQTGALLNSLAAYGSSGLPTVSSVVRALPGSTGPSLNFPVLSSTPTGLSSGDIWFQFGETGGAGATGLLLRVFDGVNIANIGQESFFGPVLPTVAPHKVTYFYQTVSNILYVWNPDTNTWVDLSTKIQGFTGSQGYTGTVGVTGFQGHTGLQAATGPQGFTGLQGVTGPALGQTGLRGETGVGVTGAQGQTGAVGVAGITGSVGVAGITGSFGAQGLTGFRGLTGFMAPTGLGATGPRGFTGFQGVTGFLGSTGPRGLTGATITGPQGFTGVPGLTGLSGTTGPQGASATGGSANVLSKWVSNTTLGSSLSLSETGSTFLKGNKYVFDNGNWRLFSLDPTVNNIQTGSYAISNAGVAQGAIVYSNVASNSPQLVGYKSRGTEALPTGMQTGDTLLDISGRGRDFNGFSSTSDAAISFISLENFSTGAHGTQIIFQTKGIGSNTKGTDVTIQASGVTIARPVAALSTMVVTGATTLTPLIGTGTRLVTSTAAGLLGNATTIDGNYTFSGTLAASNLSGTNTGNQTITLTGEVTGSGTGSFAATIANNAVTLAKMATMATASLLGRSTVGTGLPEVLSASTAKTLLSLNLVENTALSTWAGSTNITTVGTLGSLSIALMAGTGERLVTASAAGALRNQTTIAGTYTFSDIMTISTGIKFAAIGGVLSNVDNTGSITVSGGISSGNGGSLTLDGNTNGGGVRLYAGPASTAQMDIRVTGNYSLAFKLQERNASIVYLALDTTTGSEKLTVSHNLMVSKAVVIGTSAPTVTSALTVDTTFLSGTTVQGAKVMPVFGNSTTVNGIAGRFGIVTDGSAFTMAAACAVYIDAPSKGSTTITNTFGVYMANQGTGSGSYALKTGTGRNEFGDSIRIIGSNYHGSITGSATSKGWLSIGATNSDQVQFDYNSIQAMSGNTPSTLLLDPFAGGILVRNTTLTGAPALGVGGNIGFGDGSSTAFADLALDDGLTTFKKVPYKYWTGSAWETRYLMST